MALPASLGAGDHNLKAASVGSDGKTLSMSAVVELKVVSAALPVTGGTPE